MIYSRLLLLLLNTLQATCQTLEGSVSKTDSCWFDHLAHYAENTRCKVVGQQFIFNLNKNLFRLTNICIFTLPEENLFRNGNDVLQILNFKLIA